MKFKCFSLTPLRGGTSLKRWDVGIPCHFLPFLTSVRSPHERLGKNNLPSIGGDDDLDAVPDRNRRHDRQRSGHRNKPAGRPHHGAQLPLALGCHRPAANARPRPVDGERPRRRDERPGSAIARRAGQRDAGRRLERRGHPADHRYRRCSVVVLAALNSSSLMKNARSLAGVFLLLLGALLTGCASLAPQTTQLRYTLPPELHEHFELKQVPFFPQTEYQCGPAALATVLNTYGVKVTPEELVPEVYLPARKGSLQVEMLAAARRHGLVSYQLAPRAADLLREVAAGNPVIVLQNLGLIGDGWHYAVVVGYDYYWGKLYLRSGETERQVMPFFIHEFTWLRSGYWAMVALPPDRIPETADQDRWLAAVAALEHAGDVRGARTGYQAFLKRWPSNANGAIGLANTYHATGQLKEAESVLRGAERTS